MKKLIIGVCEGRHEMPCNRFVFGQEVNPLDVTSLAVLANERLIDLADEAGLEWQACPARVPFQVSCTDIYAMAYNADCIIYVTGLTVAVMAVVKAAFDSFDGVVLMHYNRESGQYYEQRIK